MMTDDLLSRARAMRDALSEAMMFGFVPGGLRDAVVRCGIALDGANAATPDADLRALLVRAETLLELIATKTPA